MIRITHRKINDPDSSFDLTMDLGRQPEVIQNIYRPEKSTRHLDRCPMYLPCEALPWFMHKRHSLRGLASPRWRHSWTANICCCQIWGWCWCPPTPPTPQICAHQKPKNWRCTHCSVYCKTSQKNLVTSSPLDFTSSLYVGVGYERKLVRNLYIQEQ